VALSSRNPPQVPPTVVGASSCLPGREFITELSKPKLPPPGKHGQTLTRGPEQLQKKKGKNVQSKSM